MLTTKGKNVLAKYLVNQAPGYAGYIAVGCGANPLSTMTFYVDSATLGSNVATFRTNAAHTFKVGDKVFIDGVDNVFDRSYTIVTVPNTTAFTTALPNILTDPITSAGVNTTAKGTATYNYVDKTSLNFEMFRVPIVSRGIVNEDSLTKVVFTAELPNLEQYGMTEIGIYPSGSNPTASTIDSRVLFNFSDTENWEYHSDVVEKPVSYIDGAGHANAAIKISTSDNFVLVTSFDPIFSNYDRMVSKEQPRFESKTLLLRGNTSMINRESAIWSVYSNLDLPENQSHIHHTNSTFSFDKNSADDQLKLAFSVISTTPSTTYDAELTNLDILVQFADSEILGTGEYANMQIEYDRGDLTSNNSNTRYYVETQSLSQLKTSPNFQWSSVNTVKVFVSAYKGNVGTNISASILTSSVATITTSTNHELAQNDIIVVRGRSGYDGLCQVASIVNTTAFTYSIIAGNISSNTTDGGTIRKPLSNYWVALDGLRFENISSAAANPLYGLTGYSLLAETAVASNGASITNYPVIKQRNTNNLIEFKFAVDAGGV
jgi:hypothetical protein